MHTVLLKLLILVLLGLGSSFGRSMGVSGLLAGYICSMLIMVLGSFLSMVVASCVLLVPHERVHEHLVQVLGLVKSTGFVDGRLQLVLDGSHDQLVSGWFVGYFF